MNHKFGGYKAAFYVHALISIPTLLIMRRFNPTPSSKAIVEKGKKKVVGEKNPSFKEGLGIVIR